MSDQQVLTSLDLNLSDRQEIGPVEAGRHHLRIVKAEFRGISVEGGKIVYDKGARINLVHEVVGEPTADNVYYTLWVPKPDDDEKRQWRAKEAIAAHRELCGLDPDGEVNLQEYVGVEYDALLSLDEENNRNEIEEILAD